MHHITEMDILVIPFSSIIFLTFIILYRIRKTRSHLPPGPLGLPLIGNLHQLTNSEPHRYLWRLSNQYGPLMFLRFGVKPVIVVSSAKMASQIMKTHDLVFASRPSMLGQRKFSYNRLDLSFSPYGEYWREMRKLCVVHLFSSRHTHSFRPIREYEVAQMIQKLSLCATSQNRVINLSERLIFFTNTLICRIAFGKRYELKDQGRERSIFHGLVNEAETLFGEFYFSDYLPWLGFVDRLRGLLNRVDKAFEQLDMFLQQVIDDHINPTMSQKKEQKDIINMLLQIMDSRSSSFDLTFDHIKALLMDIFLAGTGTSAATLVWAMTSLMKNPRVMKKVQHEVRKLYGEKDFISEDDIEKLHYLKAVVKETLRLFPPAPLLLPKESMAKCNLEGYDIQSYTMVMVNAWAIGRDPQTWEDPEQFYPERFFKCSKDFKDQYFELIPFGGGRRICPGMNMAVVTMELMLANLVHCFDWELPDGIEAQDIDMEAAPGLIVHRKNDLCLVIKCP